MSSFVLRKAINNEYYFVLKAKNGLIVATSQMYATRAGALAGIDACKRAAEAASATSFEDETRIVSRRRA
jgi:uncharacterized protein YegP (UPF0339 family)